MILKSSVSCSAQRPVKVDASLRPILMNSIAGSPSVLIRLTRHDHVSVVLNQVKNASVLDRMRSYGLPFTIERAVKASCKSLLLRVEEAFEVMALVLSHLLCLIYRWDLRSIVHGAPERDQI